MNLPFDKVFDAHWQEGMLLIPIFWSIERKQWEDSRGWLMISYKFGFKVSTAVHNYRRAKKHNKKFKTGVMFCEHEPKEPIAPVFVDFIIKELGPIFIEAFKNVKWRDNKSN